MGESFNEILNSGCCKLEIDRKAIGSQQHCQLISQKPDVSSMPGSRLTS